MNDQNQDDLQEEKDKKSRRHRMEFDLTMMQSDVDNKKRKQAQLEMDIQRSNRQLFELNESIKNKKKEIKDIADDLMIKEDELNRLKNKINQLH